ncbi:AraC family transcriptional regulator ligand-binding domain-containing protein [Shewanella sp.]|uniref:AraC family transcriptional regulator n=1 Tax=Shewanella sp. TaxID=50422 RepID=UPI003A96F99A
MALTAGFVMDDAVLPIALARGLVDLAEQQQLDVDKLLRGSRLFYEDLSQADKRLSCRQWLQLIARFCRMHPEPEAMALLYGQQQALNHLPLLSEVWANSANLAQALRHLSQLAPWFPTVVQLRPRQHGERLVLVLQSTLALGEQQRFIYSAILAALRTWLQEQLGKHLLMQVDLPWPAPQWRAHLSSALGEQLRFAAPCCAIHLKAEALFTPFATASSWRCQQFMRLARQQIRGTSVHESLQSQLRRLCRRQLQLGVTLEQGAAFVGLSPATLKRRLKQDGVSFQQLQDDVRCHEVLQRLDIYGYSNRQLAECVNINDMHNFRRAFKRWTGMLPSQFR